jgi:hypothetical protein
MLRAVAAVLNGGCAQPFISVRNHPRDREPATHQGSNRSLAVHNGKYKRGAMKAKKALRLRWWAVAFDLNGHSGARYFFTEPEARVHLDGLSNKIPATLERYPDEAVERYSGFLEDKYFGIEIRRLSANDALRRYPGTVSHMICHSLGYCTPLFAAKLVLAAARNDADWCEWIATCYGSDPWPALCAAIEQRRHHRGFMADIQQARGLVESVRRGDPEPQLASWF